MYIYICIYIYTVNVFFHCSLSLFSTCSAVSVRQGLRSQRFCISWGIDVSVYPAHGCTAQASGGKGSDLRTSAWLMVVQLMPQAVRAMA